MNIQKIIKILLVMVVVIGSSFFADDVFAQNFSFDSRLEDAGIFSNTVATTNISTNEVVVDINFYKDMNLKYIGTMLSQTPGFNTTTESCAFRNQTAYNWNIQVPVGSSTGSAIDTQENLLEDTTYYYRTCGTDYDFTTGAANIQSDGSSKPKILFYSKEYSFKTASTTDFTNITVTAFPATNITNTKATLKLAYSPTIAVDEHGFKITPNLMVLDNQPCETYPLTTKTFTGLTPNTTYHYKACVKNTAGTEFTNNTSLSFTTLETTSAQTTAKCEIDYVEFLPYNKYKYNQQKESPRFNTFISTAGEGKEVTYTIKPKNTNHCKNVPIYGIWVQYLEDGEFAAGDKIFQNLNNPDNFSENGTYSGKLVAGDRNCADDICTIQLKVDYGLYNPNGASGSSGARTFFSRTRIGNADASDSPGSSIKDKNNKGTIYYKSKGVSKKWRTFKEGTDPSYEETQKFVDDKSPCFNKDSGEYKENCYEFLAPIPGIQNDSEGVFDDKTFTVEGDRIAITNISTYKLGDYINKLFQISIAILAVIAVIMIVIAGVQYMTVESIYGKSDARQRIQNAALGLILALGIFTILNTINPTLLQINFGSGLETAGIKIDDASIITDRLQGNTTTVKTVSNVPSFKEGLQKKLTSTDSNFKKAYAAADTKKVPHCVADVILKRESAAKIKAIGFDENVANTPSRDAFLLSGKTYSGKAVTSGSKNDSTLDESSPDLGLDWRFSKGIGLTQVTFFPENYASGASRNNYINHIKNNKDTAWNNRKKTPTRTIDGITYTPKEMLDVEKNLEAGLSIWNSFYKKCNTIQGAFSGYISGSCNKDAHGGEGAKRTSMYKECVNS